MNREDRTMVVTASIICLTTILLMFAMRCSADTPFIHEGSIGTPTELTPIFRAPDKGGNAYLCPAQTARRFVYAAVCTTRAQYAAS